MAPGEEHLEPLSAAVPRLLRPLVRILLRHGVSYRTFSDLSKGVYVDVATKEFGIEGAGATFGELVKRSSGNIPAPVRSSMSLYASVRWRYGRTARCAW